MPALKRYLLIVPAAYLAACLAAGVLAAAGLAARPDITSETVIELTLRVSANTAILMLPPAVIGVLVAEFMRFRALVLWLVFGALAGIAAEIVRAGGPVPDETGLSAVLFVVAGLTGSAVYWLIAGRHSGWPGRSR